MIDFKLNVKGNFSAAAVMKQINYGTAVGLTKTAKEAQAAVVDAVKSDLTYRNNWLPQSNKFGIRVKTAKPNDLTADVHSNAGWLIKQKIGGQIDADTSNRRVFHYEYEGETYIARPTNVLRPVGSTKVLIKKLWPENLKNKYVIRTKKGTLLLMVRFGPGREGSVAMYILDKDISIKPKDEFYAPAQKVIKEQLADNVHREVQYALDNIREVK